METTIIILGIIITYLFIDIYRRSLNTNRYIRFLLLQNEIVNRILVGKNIINREEINEVKGESLEKMYIKDYESLKRDLKKLGIDMEK